MERNLQVIAKDESMRKQDKHTPSDNRQQKSQNKNMPGGQDPRTSGDSLKDIKKTVSDREAAKNESGNYNKPRRRMGEHGGGQRKRDKRKD